jgi:uncharacterized protein YybS (DUF2232 family)
MFNARIIVSGACCATALCIGGVAGPPGAALALLALPLPALVVGAVGGTSHAMLSSLAAGGLLSGLVGWRVGAIFLALAGIPTVLVVMMLRRAWRLELVVAAAVLATVACGMLLALGDGFAASAWRESLTRNWTESFDAALQMYRDLGTSADRLAEIEAARDHIADQVMRFLPAMLVVSCAALWLGNLGLSRRWASWPQLDSLARWRNADWVIWCLIAAGFAMFLPHSSVAVAAANTFVIVLACYFAQGLSIVSYFFQRFGLPRGLRVATYLVIGLQQIAAALVLLVGVFDLWGDFRHLAARHADAAVGPDSE